MGKTEILFPALVLTSVATMLLLGVFVYDYSPAVLRFPLLVGGILCALCVVRVIRAAADLGRIAASKPSGIAATAGYAPLPVRALWIFAVIPAVYLFGYLVGLPLYLLAYLRSHGESWRIALSAAIICAAAVYGVFMRLLSVPLPIHPWGWPW